MISQSAGMLAKWPIGTGIDDLSFKNSPVILVARGGIGRCVDLLQLLQNRRLSLYCK